MYNDTIEVTLKVMKRGSRKNVDAIEKELDGLIIKKLINKRKKQQNLAVRFVSENHI